MEQHQGYWLHGSAFGGPTRSKGDQNQKRLRSRVIEVGAQYGRYGYRQVTGLLNMEGWQVGKARV